jgi:nicotinamidase-related amidase
MEALLEWSRSTGRSVEYVHKGQELLTEMYSAVRADVPVTESTALNEGLVRSLLFGDDDDDGAGKIQSRRLIVAGQAMSHCVNYTVRDIVKYAEEEAAAAGTAGGDGGRTGRAAAAAATIYLVTDCASPVPGFEDAAARFRSDAREAGVRLVSSGDLAAALAAAVAEAPPPPL